jgi:acetyl-CoA synthetase
MTCSGGDSAVAADLAAQLGVELPVLAPATIARLHAVLPDAATAGNPLDYTALLWEDTAALTELIDALGADPGVGRVLVLFDEYDGRAPILDAVATARVPVMLGSTLPELVPEGGIAGLRSALLCAKAGDEDPARIAALKTVRTARRGRRLGEHETKELLREAGIPVVPGALAGNEDEAVAVWRELGGPVAVKTTGVTHKAAAGGVFLNVDAEDAVRAAYRRLDGTVLVERMAAPGLELLVAVSRDGLAPVLVVGLGGVHTELLDTATITPLPATDVDPRVADLARKLEQIPGLALIELNPVIVNTHGAVAVDALAYEEEP